MSDFIEVTELNRAGADERGWVVEPVSDAELASGQVLNIHVVCAEPGSVRGNHYHRHKQEYICVLGGAFLFVAVDESGARQELAVTPEHNVRFRLPPGVSHAMKNVGNDRGYLLCYSDKAYDPANPDTVKREVLPLDGETR